LAAEINEYYELTIVKAHNRSKLIIY